MRFSRFSHRLWAIVYINLFLGNVNDDLDFEFGSDTSARSGCGVTFMNQFWYFGGSYNKVDIISL